MSLYAFGNCSDGKKALFETYTGKEKRELEVYCHQCSGNSSSDILNIA